MTGRWQLNRAGIVNVYQYGDETLEFAGGRLLLRGVNGSGKSTAMNMLLPFLIDADARRIDAAGAQSGVIKSWMLSGRDDPQPVGYLWIEFARPSDEPTPGGTDYFVCGCGIRANQSTERVTTWWFATDRRPHVDLALVVGRVPLSSDALRAELGSHAVFAEDQRGAYRQTVRDRLFGGRDLDQHIRLLHIVRSPRVGDRIDLDLPDYLRDALPQLSDIALDDAAQPLEDLEEHRRNVSGLTRTVDNLRALTEVYRSYLATDLRRRGDDLLLRCDRVEATRLTAQRQRRHADEAARVVGEIDLRIAELESRTLVLANEIATLKESPAYQRGAELNDLRQHVETLAAAVARAERSVGAAEGQRDLAEERVRSTAVAVGDDQRRLGDTLDSLRAGLRAATMNVRPPDLPVIAAAIAAESVPQAVDELDTAPVRAGLGGVQTAAQVRADEIRDVRSALATVDARRRQLEQAERDQLQARQQLETARTLAIGRRAELQAAVASWRGALAEWHDGAAALDDALAARLDRDAVGSADILDRRATIRLDWDDAITTAATSWSAQQATVEARRRDDDATRARWAAELEDLRSRTQPDPPALGWQRAERRPTLAELIDFHPDLGEAERVGLEAALEASGLLGAEVDGGVDGAPLSLRLQSGELVATAGLPVDAPLTRLLEVTVGDDRGDLVERGAIEAVLSSISTDVDGGEPTAVDVDGRFRIGALAGRHHKEVAEHIGATARAAAIARRIADAEAELAAAVELVAARDREIARIAGIVAALHVHRRNLPPTRPLDDAESKELSALDQLAAVQDLVEVAEAAVAAADDAHAAAVDELTRLAATLQLPSEVAQLDHTEGVVRRVAESCREALDRLRAVEISHRAWTLRVEEWNDRVAALADARRQHAEQVAAHEPVAMRLATLEDSIGLEYEQIVKTLAVSEDDLRSAGQALTTARTDKETALVARTAAERDADDADDAFAAAGTDCVDAIAPLQRALAVSGVGEAISPAATRSDDLVAEETLLGSPGDDGGAHVGTSGWAPPVIEPSAQGARQLAVALLGALGEVAGDAITPDGMRQSVRQRRDQLGAGWDAEDSQPDETMPIGISVNGPLGRMPLAVAARQSALQLAQQASLLTAKQDQALRNLLQGLVAKEVADKLHASNELVALMNRRLENVRTAHGIGASLTWKRRSELDGETAEMITLLSRPPDLRTQDHDAQLTEALSRRIAQARSDDPERRYRELIAEVLDYRDWYEMGVVVHRKGRTPERLTRRTPLSEGEKKIVSYLPLFAAVAGSCDAIGEYEPSAPRFVLLDDAFAKVSEDNHAQLFGLLVDFDLDFIATSERLWGTHATVPELAITEVLRDASLGVILLEHARWNGSRVERR
ncbi:SbcC/MukB-like Walker B domain-containing protein [Desertimonas flava]|uniref:SbcC/MukB-like Walker B domain-containing protein n=1 Tax=Desertimonas flava TaxID=2064846 RepID=UPI000E34C169|nr:SbcC/MukB-like Walker B domain-containing protein [Desertimonas flava]